MGMKLLIEIRPERPAGTDMIYTFPRLAGVIGYVPLSVHATFSSSAAVATREIFLRLNLLDGNVLIEIPSGSTHLASTTRNYGFIRGMGERITPAVMSSFVVPMGDIVVSPADIFTVSAANIQGGDRFVGAVFRMWVMEEAEGAVKIVRERVEVPGPCPEIECRRIVRKL